MALSVVGLFAGIGGIELGMHQAGHRTTLLSEIDPGAQRVLAQRLPGVALLGDVRELVALPEADVVAAGFPCQDLSQAGRTAGIAGERSGLVQEVFRLVTHSSPTWLLLENVPFMLQLDRGEAMRFLAHSLESLGYRWAYRVVDARSFGLPQRRQRVIMLASRTEDPREVLFHGNESEPTWPDPSTVACGFYWTEGVRGLGWAVDAVPTLKGGSTIGIPSPPAILSPDGSVGLPALADAERLQGFPAGWTEPAAHTMKRGDGARWKLVGNAVSVPLARWLGVRLTDPQPYEAKGDRELQATSPWPRAAWNVDGTTRVADLSVWPVQEPYQPLADFLEHDPNPLSLRAAEGFISRTRRSSLNFPPRLIEAMDEHVRAIRGDQLAA